MDILDRIVGHDAWATRHLLTLCRPLADAQLDQRFGQQSTLRETVVHIVEVMESWTSRMYDRPWHGDPGPYSQTRSMAGLTQRFETISADFIALAHRIRDEGRFDDMFVDYRSEPKRRKTYGACIVHLTTHSMNHRAQIFALFDQLGVAYDGFEGDALDWEKVTHYAGAWPLATGHAEQHNT